MACCWSTSSGDAPDPAEHIGDLLEHLERYRNAELRSAGKVDYVVPANWKGIVENYNECLHCPGVHPELNALSNYMSGEEIEGDGARPSSRSPTPPNSAERVEHGERRSRRP